MELYLARDKDGALNLYNGKPFKGKKIWFETTEGDCCGIDRSRFPEVRWEDKEPTEVKLVIKR